MLKFGLEQVRPYVLYFPAMIKNNKGADQPARMLCCSFATRSGFLATRPKQKHLVYEREGVEVSYIALGMYVRLRGTQ